MALNPPNKRCVGAVGEDSRQGSFGDLYEYGEHQNVKRFRLDCRRPEPPVASYPDRRRLEGPFEFQVAIPGTGPKLYVTPSGSDDDGSTKTINTDRDHMITLSLAHTGNPANTCHRFLLVYSKDSEACQPVCPCKNHRNESHPKHMLEVKAGERDAIVEWFDEPHPSVVVIPAPSASGMYTYHITFLCRNSCVTRKDLTLLCQLEIGNKVVGREVFRVKMTASPRRDSKSLRRTASTPTTSHSSLSSSPCATSSSHTSPPIATSEEDGVVSEGITREAKRMAHLVYVEQYFKESFPEQHRHASEQFSHLWNTGKFNVN